MTLFNMHFAILLLVALCAAFGNAQQVQVAASLSSDLSQPTPYEFAYTVEGDDGTYGHSEKFDGFTKAEGNYYLKLADGRERTVTYTADETGFHPEIQTNELGTESKNPGDVVIVSSAPSGPDAAIQAYGGPFPESLGNVPSSVVRQVPTAKGSSKASAASS